MKHEIRSNFGNNLDSHHANEEKIDVRLINFIQYVYRI